MSVKLPSFAGATGWLNGEPLASQDLRGDVVLVQFGTFTCINWLRTLPALRAWIAAYAGDGLRVIGVHTPEFPFERDHDNVRRELARRRLAHPFAVDNAFGVWDAFANRYWPALYLADREGTIRYEHPGEGRYEETEQAIQRLLGIERPPVAFAAAGDEVSADWDAVGSPETYLGTDRGERSVTTADPGLNEWTLSGAWSQEPGHVALHEAGGSFAFRFHARDLNLVMGPAGGAPVRFRATLDGRRPAEAYGLDMDSDGAGTVSEQRMYQLIRQPGPVTDRTLELTFLDPGLEAYVLTFG